MDLEKTTVKQWVNLKNGFVKNRKKGVALKFKLNDKSISINQLEMIKEFIKTL